MGFFDKFKSKVTGADAPDAKTAGQNSPIRLTEKQLTIKEWLGSLSPEWQAALDSGWSSINVSQTDEELDRKFRELTSFEVSDNAKIKDLSPVADLIFFKGTQHQ